MSTQGAEDDPESMEILSDYRIQSRMASEQELARAAERVRVALERAPRHQHRRNLWQMLGIRRPITNPVTGPITSPIATHPTA
jgi:hypothetical protein